MVPFIFLGCHLPFSNWNHRQAKIFACELSPWVHGIWHGRTFDNFAIACIQETFQPWDLLETFSNPSKNFSVSLRPFSNVSRKLIKINWGLFPKHQRNLMKAWELFPKPIEEIWWKFESFSLKHYEIWWKFESFSLKHYEIWWKFESFSPKALWNLMIVWELFPQSIKKFGQSFENFSNAWKMFHKVWEILSQKEQLFFHETHQNLDRIRRWPSKKEEMSALKISWDLSPKAINKLDVSYQNVYKTRRPSSKEEKMLENRKPRK